MVEAVRRGVLDCEKLAGIGVVLHVAVGPDQQFVSGDKAAAPAGHVKALARRVQFDADFLRSGGGEEAQWPALENQRGIGRVMYDDEVVLSGELHDVRKKLRCVAGAGGVIGIVEHQDLGLGQHFGGNGIEVGQKLVRLGEVQVVQRGG